MPGRGASRRRLPGDRGITALTSRTVRTARTGAVGGLSPGARAIPAAGENISFNTGDGDLPGGISVWEARRSGEAHPGSRSVMPGITIHCAIAGIIMTAGAQAGGPGAPLGAGPGGPTWESREQCYRASLAAAVDSYAFRVLGRSEAWQSGALISGNGSPENSYALRALGRSEARWMGTAGEDRVAASVPIQGRRAGNPFRLRAMGRQEAHGTGTDPCLSAGAVRGAGVTPLHFRGRKCRSGGL